MMLKNKISSALCLLVLLLPVLSMAQDKSLFDRGTFISKGDTLPYRILFPKNFDPQKKYPLIMVLHGAGERGNDNKAQLAYGTNTFLKDTIREKYAAFVVYPQCPANGWWANNKFEQDSVTHKTLFIFQADAPPTEAMKSLLGLVDELLDKPYIDKHRVYVGGLSMGGMGTYEIIARKPKVFAAAFAICGGDNTLNAKKYAKKVPLWIFHGAKDSVVPFSHSESMVTAIRDAGGDPKFTVYPNDDHNSWDDAFREPLLIPWLFSHRK
ncbi:MAG TPA: prolyl oligopeptidase family serine peptidase [Mucilaginibacter sp.]|nr:prolyl oligopeptidase family serine peptidase [Mucilaginibacter sp.]